MDRTVKTVFEQITAECKKQDDKWGSDRKQRDLYWLGILMEEVGELAKAIIEDKPVDIETELLHATAVGVQWMAAKNRLKVCG